MRSVRSKASTSATTMSTSRGDERAAEGALQSLETLDLSGTEAAARAGMPDPSVIAKMAQEFFSALPGGIVEPGGAASHPPDPPLRAGSESRRSASLPLSVVPGGDPIASGLSVPEYPADFMAPL